MEHTTWLDLFLDPHTAHTYWHVFMAALVLVLMAILGLLASRGIRKREDVRVPEDRLSLLNVVELGVQGLEQLCVDVIGPEGRKYMWLMGAVFFYIFMSNLLSLFPGFLPPTENVNTNFAVAVVVFLVYNAYGLKEHGVGYLKHFMGPVWWLAVLILPIELIGHVVRPASLTIRLYGNLFGEGLVGGIFQDLVPLFIPVIFMALGLFIAFIQAFVFTLLSMVYVSLATEHEH